MRNKKISNSKEIRKEKLLESEIPLNDVEESGWCVMLMKCMIKLILRNEW